MDNSIKKARNSNVEFLRIICMFLLIIHHFIVHGGILLQSYSTNVVISYAIMPIGKICFCAFVAMSTWFLCDSTFSSKKFLKVWFEVLFYNILFTSIAFLVFDSASIYNILGAFFPMLGNSHGYAAAYLWFYLCLPFLKKIINNIKKEQTIGMLFILGMTQICLPILAKAIDYTQPLQSEFLLFVFCFFVSLYLRRFSDFINKPLLFWIILFLILSLYASFVSVATIKTDNLLFTLLNSLNSTEFSIVNLVAGFALFQIFNNIKLPQSKIINSVATTTFGILLFHDHNYFRGILWSIVMPVKYVNLSSIKYLVALILISLIIFVIGMIIDYIRQLLFENAIVKTKTYDRISLFIDKFFA